MVETIGEIQDVVVGNFGQTVVLTAYDADGQVSDLSAYTGTKTIYLRSPNGNKTRSASCSFQSDGTNGKVQFTLPEGIDVAGDWICTLTLTKSGAVLNSVPILMSVNIKVGG